jgi:hypothetical protein
MIRKQLSIEQRHQEKLRRLAQDRRCSEAEVVRQAIDALPDPSPPSNNERIFAELRARGMLLESDEPPVSDEEMTQIEARWKEARRRIGNIHLAEAVMADREERDAFLARHVGDAQTLRH